MASHGLAYDGCNFFRQRLVLSTLSGKRVKISNIRSKDENPGLRGELHLHSACGVAVSSAANVLALTQLGVGCGEAMGQACRCEMHYILPRCTELCRCLLVESSEPVCAEVCLII